MERSSSAFRSLNQDLDSFAGLDIPERALRVVELDLARDEFLDANPSGGEQVDGRLVVSAPVAEASFNVELLGAHGDDGECDVGFAHAALSRSWRVSLADCLLKRAHGVSGKEVSRGA